MFPEKCWWIHLMRFSNMTIPVINGANSPGSMGSNNCCCSWTPLKTTFMLCFCHQETVSKTVVHEYSVVKGKWRGDFIQTCPPSAGVIFKEQSSTLIPLKQCNEPYEQSSYGSRDVMVLMTHQNCKNKWDTLTFACGKSLCFYLHLQYIISHLIPWGREKKLSSSYILC